jgi:molybdopterin molybdotransferase
MGFADPRRPAVRLRVSEALTSPRGKTQLRRGIVDAVAGTVTPIGGAGSHLLGALAQADSLIVVPADTGHVDEGDSVEVWLLA